MRGPASDRLNRIRQTRRDAGDQAAFRSTQGLARQFGVGGTGQVQYGQPPVGMRGPASERVPKKERSTFGGQFAGEPSQFRATKDTAQSEPGTQSLARQDKSQVPQRREPMGPKALPPGSSHRPAPKLRSPKDIAKRWSRSNENFTGKRTSKIHSR